MPELLGYRVTATTSAIQALSFFCENPDGIDLVISDKTMPEMTGALLTEKILAIRPDLPVILCTGHSDTLNTQKALSFGAKSLLMKPLESERLAQKVRKILDGQ